MELLFTMIVPLILVGVALYGTWRRLGALALALYTVGPTSPPAPRTEKIITRGDNFPPRHNIAGAMRPMKCSLNPKFRE